MSLESILSELTKRISYLQGKVSEHDRRIIRAPFHADSSKVLGIVGGSIEATRPYIHLVPEAGITDTLNTITNGSDGKVIIVANSRVGDTITVNPYTVAAGNIDMHGSANPYILDNIHDSLTFIYREDIAHWEQIGANGTGNSNVATFLDLTDTPAIYTGDAGKVVIVNSTENGLEFIDASLSPGLMGGYGGDSVEYIWLSTTIDADPGISAVVFNHATFASVTQIYIDDENIGADDVQTWLAYLGSSTNPIKGVLRAWKRSNNLVFRTFAVTGVEEAIGYWKINVIPIVSAGASGTFLNGDIIILTFARAGDSPTASNVGTGVGVWKDKVANDLRFRSILAASSKITIALATDDIIIDVAEGNLTLDSIGSTLGIAKGGTGQVTAAAAIVALGGTRKYAASIGNGAATSIVVNHALATSDVLVMVRQAATPFAVVYPDIEVTDANNVTVIFTTAPTTNQYRVVVIG